jgi:hypothetical protein
VQTLLEIEELKEVKNSCKEEKDKRKWFKLFLLASLAMPDATIITVTEKTNFKLLRDWHKTNKNVKEKGTLNYSAAI